MGMFYSSSKTRVMVGFGFWFIFEVCLFLVYFCLAPVLATPDYALFCASPFLVEAILPPEPS